MSDPYIYVDGEEMELIRQVVDSQELWRGTSGAMVGAFEDEFATHLGRRYVHALCSGTSANEAALAACDLQPGDEVIVTPCSFIASSLAAVAVGAIPVFADVDPRNFVLTAETIEAAITPRAKAVVVVHLWGQPADMGPILEVARRHNLKVVEDCAQCYDGYWHGRKAGSLGDVACFSMQQSKHLTAGEGGMVATDDPDAYRRVVLYCNCGMPWYRFGLAAAKAEAVAGLPTRGHFAFGHNYRLSELQGAAALAQLRKIERLKARRAQIKDLIEQALANAPGLLLARPYPDTVPTYWAYPVLIAPETGFTADEVIKWSLEEGASPGRYVEINYLEAVYRQMEASRHTSLGLPLPDYVHYRPGLCPVAEEAAPRLLMFGCVPWADDDSLRHTCECLRRAMAKHCR